MNKEITSETLKKLLSQKLTLLREKSGETMEETAFDLGLDTSDYFKFLKGKRLPHLLTLLRLGQKYGVSLSWWFSELEGIPSNKMQSKNNSLELRVARIIGNLDDRLQKAALSMLKASVKNLLSVSR
ncbi:transcriptional regulator XRE family [Candidatus Termititenax aidoneus]|uniref:Transcriptional regulator XRE family n=1 Tax=Termititenax aidoneus TaxID=2218524 RepID=A0A388TD18_TERA1|nr:transcriptional regulator XRE family [Candidatus Termititenax aidoneus]